MLAALYIFQYCATEFATQPVALPFRLAALTQALLVSGEFWFFAIPIDLVQSITNPFTSYAHNVRMYWVYATLSGAVCGVLLWVVDDTSDGHDATDTNDHRFFWFHHNTNMPGFFWHRWLLYHVWVLVYLVFGVACIRFVTRRLRRGLEETFDVRRHVLSHGIVTCAVYISWSGAILALFALTNVSYVKHALGPQAFATLVHVSAFFHAARGCVNIIVWLVVNASSVGAIWRPPRRPTPAHKTLDRAGSSASSSAASGDAQAPLAPPGDAVPLLNPQLNRALRRQIVHMATSGIIESVEHFHARRQRIESNQTFALDWDRPQHHRLAMAAAASATPTIQVVEPRGRRSASASGPPTSRFALFLPVRMKEMQFYDFQPRVFAAIRLLYGIDDRAYRYAFRATVNERISEGRSGAFVFNTCDRKYLVKSMTSDEQRVLLELLPSYWRYLKWNPATLLPRFFGVHAMKMYGQVFYFVVMGNVLSTSEPIHRRYDIKGSWVDRNAPACVLGERYRCSKCNRFFTFGVPTASESTGTGAASDSDTRPCDALGSEHYPDITLRDNDLKKRLKVAPETARTLLKQLTRDSNFLASMGIMDYSLLIGTRYSHFTIDTPAPTAPIAPAPAAPELERDASFAPADTVDRAFVHTLVDQDPTAAGRDDAARAPAKPVMTRAASTHAQSHCYRANQVSGPSAYYFGLVDVLQQWTLGKQAERVYKVHVLRKAARGVSAMAPKPYAARFQQKMHQLFSSSLVNPPLPPTEHHVMLVPEHADVADDALADLVV